VDASAHGAYAKLNATSHGSKAMKPFTTAALVIFALVAIVHALRLLLGWNITLNGTEIPMWVSIVALVISAGLAVGLWRESV
jgi:hypothetical protein